MDLGRPLLAEAGAGDLVPDVVLADAGLADPVLGDPVLGDPVLGDPVLEDLVLEDLVLGDLAAQVDPVLVHRARDQMAAAATPAQPAAMG